MNLFRRSQPAKAKVQRVSGDMFRWFGAGTRVDVVAQQVLDNGESIFNAVKRNAIDEAMALIEDNEYCLLLRDSAGAAPVHIAFLFGHYELGKQIVMKSKRFATLTYSYLDPDAVDPSPYEGENILHIAIVHRKPGLALWLLQEVPELINAEATGKFFRPTRACYFGGTPLLFALSSNQINVALDILDTAERLKANKPQDEPVKEGTTVLKQDPQQSRSSQVFADTSIFMCDRFGNNVLHLAVIHDLPNVYNFALLYVMRLLSPRHFKKDGFATGAMCEIHDSEGIQTIESHKPMLAEDLILSEHSSSLNEVDKNSARKLHASRSKRRLAEFTAASEDSNVGTFVEFLKRADDAAYEKMLGFILQRNSDELTPLSLAAARANERMFQHILKQSTSIAWCYGPITAMHLPLFDLEQPLPRPDSNFGRFQVVHDILTSLPYPLAPKGKKGYKTAIQCLCSLEPLSNTLSTRVPSMERIVTRRLEMLKLFEVKLLLQKKWKYVGKRRFMIRLTVYLVFLFFLNVTTLFERNAYRTGSIAHVILLGIAEVGCFGLATVKFMNETNQLILNFKSYTTEAGAGRLDNVCTLMTSTSLYLSAVMRATHHENLEDAFAAIALIFAWFYLFFFLLGFRSTGPFVIMILNMIMNDIVRFIFVYVAIMAGFSQALYLVQDGRAGVKTLLHRIRMLVIAGFTGEVNYDDNYTSGRMNTLTQVLMLGYIILVMILLVNLLIAMMGNTYSEILQESEQRWVAERANIMSTIENQCTAERNHQDRKNYAIPLQSRHGEEILYLQIEVNEMENWKKQGSGGQDEGDTL